MKLNVEGIEFSYNGKPVLDKVCLKIEEGDILGLIGPNGSGKSTFLRCLNKILRPQRGVIYLDDNNLNTISRKNIAKKMGYVPQQETQKFPNTVFDTILMGRKPYIKWKAGSRDLKIVSDIITGLGLEKIAHRNINELSGGERQKVIMARSLVQDPDILLLDEPTSSLDLKHQLEILNLIKEQSVRGISSILAIHDLSLAGRYCDKIILLNNGRVYAAGGKEVISSENIESVYGVRVSVKYYGEQIMVIPDKPINI